MSSKQSHPAEQSPLEQSPAGTVRPKRNSLIMALEPRIMFDGAIAASTVDAIHTADPQPSAAPVHIDTPPPPAAQTEIVPQRVDVVFIDTTVNHWETLRAGVQEGAEVVLLDNTRDGLVQMAGYLEGRSDIDSIHIISHGQIGQLNLGTARLDLASSDNYAAQLQTIGAALGNDGDILLYGCNVGAGAEGAAFLSSLATATGADVAASIDATGHAGLNGNWVLETSTGAIESGISIKLSAQYDYNGVLATPITGTTTFNTATTSGLGNGNGGMVVTATNVFSTGWDFSATFGANTNTANLLRGAVSGGTGVNPTYSGAIQSGAAGGDQVQSVTFSSNDGSEFDLKSIDINSTQGATNITITGYKNGALVSGATLNSALPQGDLVNRVYTTVNIDGNNDFNDIDKFTITYGTPQTRILYDNISVGTAVASAPTLTSATLADTNLKIGETSLVTFVFSEAVSGFTTADLTTPNGAVTGLSTSNGGTAWTGTFTPNATVTDATNVITVDLTGIASVATSNAGVGTADSNNYAIDTQAPSITAVSSPDTNSHYVTGQTIGITVTFDDNVTITGTPQLTLETGSTDRVVNYSSGSGTNTLTFSYTVQAGDTSLDLDYLSTNALSLNGGTIRDSSGNDATLTLVAPGAAGSLGANKALVIDSAPTIGNLGGDSVTWAGVGNTVTLDLGGNAILSDTEFGALNSGNGNWAGATLTVRRPGATVAADTFGFDTTGATFSVSGGNLQSGGLTFATYTSTSGVLTVNFTSSGTAATTALMQDLLRHITYRNDTPTGNALARFTLDDGYSSVTADVTVASDFIYVTNVTDTSAINVSNGVSFSEAVAIAAADITGTQTLVFSSAFNTTMTLAGNLAINESLAINADSANGLAISGSTITLGGSTTLAFTNATGSVTLSSAIAGTGALDKAGSGTLSLGGSNSGGWSGGISVTGGSLQLGSDDHASSGTLTLNGGALSNGTISFNLDNAITLGAGGGTVNVGGTDATQLTLSGLIGGTGSLTKVGQAILRLDSANTYSGVTSLSAGTLIANNADALGTTAGDTTVSSGATLRVAGGLTLAEALTISGTGKQVSAIDYGALHLTTGSSSLSGNLTVAGDANISAASGAVLTISGALNGSANLNKTDVGTLILSNTGNESGLGGGIVVAAGTLSIANDDHLGSGVITLNGGTLAITGATTIDNTIAVASSSIINASANATLSGTVSGAGDLAKTGASTLSLGGTNTATGAVNIAAGGLTINGGNSIGNTSAVTVSSGATLTLSGGGETIGSLAGAGNVVLGYNLTTGGNNTSTSFSGVISGSGNGIVKNGSGTFTLTGANSYTGSTTVNAGTLTISGSGTAGNGSAATITSGATLSSSVASLALGSLAGAGTLSFGANTVSAGSSTSTTFSGNLNGSGTLVKTGTGTLTLSGNNSGSSAAIQVNGSGTLAVASDNNLTSGNITLNASTLRLTGATTVDNAITLSNAAIINADAAAGISGAIGGNGSLTISGSNTLTLSNTHNYSGSTTVSSGTLSVTGALSATSGVSVLSGATLSGSGSIFALNSTNTLTVQSGGTLSPGNSAGIFTIDGNLAMASGSTLAIEINGPTAGTDYDQVFVNGTVDVSGATLSTTHNYTANLGDSYTIIVNDAADAVTGAFSGLGEGATTIAGGNGTVLTASYSDGTGNDVTLTAPVNPVVLGVSSNTADGTYKIGDTVSINVTFDQPVTVDTTNGSPTLLLETGTTDRILNYVSGSGSPILTFSYTVQAGDTSADLDYTSTTALALNGGTIRDALSVNANLTLATPGAANSLGATKNIVVDGVRPTAGIVVADTALAAGETSTVTITFNEAVSGLTTADFNVENGVLNGLGSSDGGITWTATLTPDTSVEDATNLITLNNTSVTDAAGNTGTGTTDSNNYAIDTLRPTASIVVADTALAAGETSTVTITFNEAVSGLAAIDFNVENGVLSSLGSSDGGVTWTATLTPNTNLTDTTNLITLANSGVVDAAGNAGTGTTDSNIYAIDTLRPTASIVVADTALAAGETSTVTVTFNEAVTGLTTSDFTIVNGALSGLNSFDGGIIWTATLTPDIPVEDTTNLITLTNNGVTDAAGNTGAGTTDSNNYAIDTLRPTASIVVADTALNASETSLVTITFNEAVTGLTAADFTIANGALSGLGTSDGGITWTATLTPDTNITNTINLITLTNSGVTDAAGNTGTGTTHSNNYAIDTLRPTASIVVDDTALAAGETSTVTITFSEAVSGLTTADFSVTNGTLSGVSTSDGGITWTATLTPDANITATANFITLNNTGVIDAAGNTGTGTTASNNYAIDAVRPTASIVVTDTALNAGETSLVTITFSEAVTDLTTTDFTVANGTLNNLASADGGITWTATLTPATGVDDTTNLVTLDNTGVTDLADNPGTGTTDSNNYALDTAVATITSVTVPANNLYVAGQQLDFTVHLSEAVTVDTAGGTPRIAINLDTGGTVYAEYVSGSGTAALLFRLTVSSGQLDTNGISVGSSIDLNGSSLKDSANNNADNTLNNTGITTGVRIDAVIPTVASVSVPVAVQYNAGDALNFIVNTSENVIVNTSGGTPRIALDIGGTTVYADYAAGSGTTTLVFQYTVQPGDSDTNGIAITGNLDANGGTLRDPAGNALTLALDNIGDTTGVIVDTTTPTVTGIVRVDGSPTNAGSVRYTLTWSEDVSGVDTSDFTVTGTGTVNGTLDSVIQIDARTYTLVVSSITGTGILGIELNNSGTGISDNAGNLISGGVAGAFYSIDRDPPVVTSVAVPADGTYVAGQLLDFTVNLNESVMVDTTGGTPRLAINLDSGTVYADYRNGTGTGALTFRLVVASGQLDTNGINIASIDANGGSLRDSVGNNINTTLNNVGALTSIRVDAVAPTVGSVSVPVGVRYNAGYVLNFIVNTSENVIVNTAAGVPRIALDIGGNTAWATYVAGSNTNTLVFQYTVKAGDNNFTSLGNSIQSNGAVLRDTAGNTLNVALNNVGDIRNIVVDTTAPLVTGISLSGTPSAYASSVVFIVDFSEAVNGVDVADFALITTGSASGTLAALTQVSDTRWEVTVNGIRGAGDVRLDVVGNGITDLAANNLAAPFTAGASFAAKPAPVFVLPVQPTTLVTPSPAPAIAPFAGPVAPLIVLNPSSGFTGVLTSVDAPVLATINSPSVSIASATTTVTIPGLSTAGTTSSITSFDTVILGTETSAPENSGEASGGGANTGTINANSLLGSVTALNFNAAPSAFIDRTTATSGDVGLQAAPEAGNFSFQPGETIYVALPANTFSANAGSQLTIEVRQQNGEPLPKWLRFDPVTGTLTGQAPKDFNGKVEIQVIVRDSKGNSASSHVEVQVGNNPQAGAELIEINRYQASDIQAKPALDSQFARYGQQARDIEANALLQQLHALNATTLQS